MRLFKGDFFRAGHHVKVVHHAKMIDLVFQIAMTAITNQYNAKIRIA
ncbi:hypothetical protein NBC2815_01230 [Xanthomonas fragariae]|nr:hypothetical protein NBC2815_01230 [Xanthomonas fragariae]